MARDTISLEGAALAGLEFVLGPDNALFVNGERAAARIADSTLDMCGAIVSLTLAPSGEARAEDLARWLEALRAAALARERG